MAVDFWTEERITLLKEMAAAGNTARQVADSLGTTRNSIIGKSHRLGISINSKAAKSGRPAARKPASARPLSPAPQFFVPAKSSSKIIAAPPTERVKLMDLEPWSCRFPFGHPRDPDFGFCGKHKPSGSPLPYCDEHAAITYVKHIPSFKRREVYA